VLWHEWSVGDCVRQDFFSELRPACPYAKRLDHLLALAEVDNVSFDHTIDRIQECVSEWSASSANNRQRIWHNASLAALRSEREHNQRWIEKTLDAIQEGLDVKSVKERYNATEGRQREIEALLEQNFDAPVLLHPNMGGGYQAEVQNLLQSLDDEEHRSKSGQILRGLIEKVTLTPELR
jgi:hypothetical protein